jgi:hypothetical protein
MAGMIPGHRDREARRTIQSRTPDRRPGMTGRTVLLNYRTVLVFTSTASGFRHVSLDAQSCALRCR